MKARKTPKLPVQQLFILSLCRFAEPIALTSVFPYLPEMIESFNVPKNKVARWAGIASAVFSLSQALTGVFWGRASDRFGRKPVIVTCMLCVMLASLLFGFSRSLAWAIAARAFAGSVNGNVGIIRTTVAELVPQKELQPRAFSVMPLVWTIGSIFGPGFGGALANPAVKYPHFFGQSEFFKTFPYALPNIASTVFFFVGLFAGILFLKETLESKKHRRDRGRVLGAILLRLFTKKKKQAKWSTEHEQSTSLLRHSPSSSTSTGMDDIDRGAQGKVFREAPPKYSEVFSRQSNINLLTYTLLALHSVAYDQLLPVFMHYPALSNRASDLDINLPFKFGGGFGIDSARIGLLFTLYGVCGMFIQFLVFPPVARRYGVLPCLKVVTIIFPIIYLATPYTALMPTAIGQQIAIMAILVFKCFAVVFAFPCTTILLTNSAASLRVLGTLNGVSTSISALGRAAGPAIGGWTFSIGVDKGYMIVPWWTLAAFAALGALPVWWLIEMDGFGGDADDDFETEVEDNLLPSNSDALNISKPTAVGGSIPEQDAMEEDRNIGLDGSTELSKGTSNNSDPMFGQPLRRMSSPIGLKQSVGPGGDTKLSNGLGHSHSGFGSGGTSYH